MTGNVSDSRFTTKDVQHVIMDHGTKGWNFTKQVLKNHKTESKELRQALDYLTEQPDYFRSAMIALCCEAVGDNSEKPLLVASAATSLLGRAAGIHDDIIDQLVRRKERFTALGKFGMETSLILGDLLIVKAFTLLKQLVDSGARPTLVSEILETIDNYWLTRQSEGEIAEIRSRGKVRITTKDCLKKIRKRASEMEAITRIGAILGSATRTQIDIIGFYGRSIGITSLLRDEFIDMLEPDVLKHRLHYESLPLPLVCSLKDSKSKQIITRLVSKDDLTTQQVLNLRRIAIDTGGFDFTAQRINTEVRKAVTSLNQITKRKEELILIANSLRLDPTEYKLSRI